MILCHLNKLKLNVSLKRLKTTKTAVNNLIKVAIVGACGSIGTNMSLLLKMNPLINEIVMIDINQKTMGVALDLSHVSTPSKVRSFVSPFDLKTGLANCNIVMITAGKKRKFGIEHDVIFQQNATIIKDITLAICDSCPNAFIGIITNPLNSLVPLVNKTMENEGIFSSKRVFGVTTIDVIRAKTIIGEMKKLNPMVVDIPVIGGHSDNTIVPLISKIKPAMKFDENEIKILTNKIRNVGNEILRCKGDCGSTISMAYAGARMTSSLVRAILGEKNIAECAYVKTDSLPIKYLCLPVVIGQEGVESYYKIDNLTSFEQELFKIAVEDLKQFIDLGENF